MEFSCEPAASLAGMATDRSNERTLESRAVEGKGHSASGILSGSVAHRPMYHLSHNQKKVSKGQSQPEIVAVAFFILYMVLGRPF